MMWWAVCFSVWLAEEKAGAHEQARAQNIGVVGLKEKHSVKDRRLSRLSAVDKKVPRVKILM